MVDADGRIADRPGRPSLLVATTVASTINGFLLPYARHFRGRGWTVDAVASGATGYRALHDAFDQVHDLPASRSLRDVRALARSHDALRDLVEAGAYDLVHVHTPIASFLARAIVRRMPRDRRPAVAYTAHGFHFHRDGHALTNAAFRTAERIAGRWTDRLVVINREDRDAALRARIVPARRLVWMPGIGIDTDRYAPDAVSPEDVARARADLGLAPAAPLFLLIAEMTPRKRHADAIAALAAMGRRDAVLALAGEGPRRAEIERDVTARGLGDRVRFLGFVRDVRALIRASTAVLLPSSREGLARSVMEALSLEVPVIASTARGNAELVGGDAGFVVPVGDRAALAARMDWLVEHPDDARDMGRRGRARMRSLYDERRLIALHEAMYEAMLEERDVRRDGGARR